MKYRWAKEEEETRQMYDMVVKIIGTFSWLSYLIDMYHLCISFQTTGLNSVNYGFYLFSYCHAVTVLWKRLALWFGFFLLIFFFNCTWLGICVVHHHGYNKFLLTRQYFIYIRKQYKYDVHLLDIWWYCFLHLCFSAVIIQNG